MDKLTQAASSMIDAVTPALQKLSETFCVSVDYIRGHAMQYIMEYGKYHLTTQCIGACLLSLIIFIIIISCIEGITYYYIYDRIFKQWEKGDFSSEEGYAKVSQKFKRNIIIGIFGVLIGVCITLIVTCIPYWISPEMYSLNAVMQLVCGYTIG